MIAVNVVAVGVRFPTAVSLEDGVVNSRQLHRRGAATTEGVPGVLGHIAVGRYATEEATYGGNELVVGCVLPAGECVASEEQRIGGPGGSMRYAGVLYEACEVAR